MNELTKDIISILFSIISTSIAVYALIISRKTSKKASKIESSSLLAEIHEKISDSRRIMQDIYREWKKDRNKNLIPSELILNRNIESKNDFIKFYNDNYHTRPSVTQERKCSNQIHSYLHEIHHLWLRYENKEFELKEIMNRFHVALSMDKELLLLFLEAHWLEHGELNKDINDRFWNKIPVFIEAVDNWKE